MPKNTPIATMDFEYKDSGPRSGNRGSEPWGGKTYALADSNRAHSGNPNSGFSVQHGLRPDSAAIATRIKAGHGSGAARVQDATKGDVGSAGADDFVEVTFRAKR